MSSIPDIEAQGADGFLTGEGTAEKSTLLPLTWRRRLAFPEGLLDVFSQKRKASDVSQPNDKDLTDLRFQAIKLLFGLESAHTELWPGVNIVFGSWENAFGALLGDNFDVTWKILEREKPKGTHEVWHWCLKVLHALQTLQANANVSMEDVYRELVKGKSIRLSASEKDFALFAIFSVICWSSMTLAPDLQLDQPGGTTATAGQLFFRAKGAKSAEETSQLAVGHAARRPITKVFRGLRGITLEDVEHVVTAAEVAGTDTIYESSVNIFSLHKIGRVRVKWVENMTSHLAFDRQSRTLSIFCLPTFCVSNILQTQEIKILQQVSDELLHSKYRADSSNHDSSALHREILLTYRLLFGQSANARAFSVKLLEQLERSSRAIDPFLRTICSTKITQSRFLRRFTKPKFPAKLLPMSNLDLYDFPIESNTYSSRNDFPYFGSRILALQQYNLTQQPRRVRDLWRDRRNPLQWYTFWAVLWIGGISIILSLLQLAATIVQTYYAVPR
ncbi:hypothetical protein BDV09DRAFT_163825 [Aspergillus tetrazonus]